jgi:hypothetical protein
VSDPVTWTDLTHLLHDARLARLAWRPADADVTLWFHCLRRNTDGSPITEPTVRLVVSGVSALAVAYDGTCRPSEFAPTRSLTAADLRGWDCGAEPYAWVNAPAQDERLLDALRVDWFAGAAGDVPSCAYRLGLSFGHGFPSLWVLIGGAKLEAFAGRDPLPLDLWAEQYNAWWGGWRRHWAGKGKDPDPDAVGVAEDLAIPAAVDAPLPADYPWPDEPVVEWEPTDAPADLLAALAGWFEAEAARPRGSFDLHERFYARQVDSWWMEGKRAAATIRGVEHRPPVGEYAASNVECVQACLLRRSASGWVVQPLSRSWPPYGSAPARPAREKPWLGRWKSGAVLSERRAAPAD